MTISLYKRVTSEENGRRDSVVNCARQRVYNCSTCLNTLMILLNFPLTKRFFGERANHFDWKGLTRLFDSLPWCNYFINQCSGLGKSWKTQRERNTSTQFVILRTVSSSLHTNHQKLVTVTTWYLEICPSCWEVHWHWPFTETVSVYRMDGFLCVVVWRCRTVVLFVLAVQSLYSHDVVHLPLLSCFTDVTVWYENFVQQVWAVQTFACRTNQTKQQYYFLLETPEFIIPQDEYICSWLMPLITLAAVQLLLCASSTACKILLNSTWQVGERTHITPESLQCKRHEALNLSLWFTKLTANVGLPVCFCRPSFSLFVL